MSTLAFPTPLSGIPEFPVRRFSIEEYHQLGRYGILSEDDEVELLEGWIVPKMIRTPPLDVAVKLADHAIGKALPRGFHVRVQSAVTTADSEPEPDLAVVRGDIRDYTHRHPGTADVLLVVEVAESSLLRDRGKRRLYARAEFPEYWIVNLVDRQIEVYSQPSVGEQPARYAQERILPPDESFSLTMDGTEIAQISVGDLLP